MPLADENPYSEVLAGMFHTSVPATAESFHDRKRELGRLHALVARLEEGHPQWLAIIGPRKVGKTSLILELARQAATDTVRFILLDTFEAMPLSVEIFRRYAFRTLDAALSGELGTSLELAAQRPADYRAALQHSSRFASLPPEFRVEILNIPEQKLTGTTIQRFLELPERLAVEWGLRFIVAIDEFQELASLGSTRATSRIPDPLPLMRSVWQTHRGVSYVVSGSARAMLMEMVTSRHSPFFQHFGLMDLGPFEHREACQLLTEQAPQERPISAALADRAVRAIGGHPFYLQIIGETLTVYDPPYSEDDLKAATQDALFSRSGRLSLYFEHIYHRLVGRSTNLAAVLNCLADGPRRLTDIAKKIEAASGATARYIERLGDALQHLDDGHYAIDDHAFRLWLSWRQPGGSVVPMRILGNEAELRVAEHLARMGFDLIYQSRASRGAFDILAIRGAVQLGLQVKRSSLTVRFSKSHWSRMKADGERLGWRWVVAVVTVDDDVLILNPAKAGYGREVRLGKASIIENLLQWLDA